MSGLEIFGAILFVMMVLVVGGGIYAHRPQ
jgi:flagellin-like protein